MGENSQDFSLFFQIGKGNHFFHFSGVGRNTNHTGELADDA
jgi:hypothetical protein